MKHVFALASLALATTICPAHYNMLLPQAASAKKGEPVALIYQWGHPFEHQLFDAPAPESLLVVMPDGKRVEWTKELKRTTVATDGGKTVASFRLDFTPDQRGDYLFLLKSAPIWLSEEEEFVQDSVKVVLHVQVQKGWDVAAGLPLEIVPLTRPYGLQPGMVFQAEFWAEKKPLAGTLVEIEHYHSTRPPMLPPDEQITRTAKTDPNGVVTCTLTETGWWCLTAQRDGSTRQHDGKEYPLRQRSTLWVFVDESATK